MRFTYQTQGTCSTEIAFDLIGNKIYNVKFTGGCNGNLKAIAKLIDGSDSDDVVKKLLGNTCGFRTTSCADQLAKAILKAKQNNQ